MRIVAMGGGDLGAGETLAMDRELIALAGKPNPRALFIPTASEDAEDYVEQFQNIYGGEGCSVEVILFWSQDDGQSAREKLERSDLVYVGGGNTKRMIAKWRSEGFDEALTKFIGEDRPVGGLSAGAICWFRIANSDWPLYEEIPGVNTASLGLPWLCRPRGLPPHPRRGIPDV